jgi:hypothetical protein
LQDQLREAKFPVFKEILMNKRTFLLLLPLLLACTPLEEPYIPPVEDTFDNLLIPAVYASIQEAASLAIAGDTLRVATGSYEEHVLLPGGVSLLADGADLCHLTGSLSIEASSVDCDLDGLRISNPAGIGLLIAETWISVTDCWIDSCLDAGVRVHGNANARISSCQINDNGRGVLVTGSTGLGHYEDLDHPTGTAPLVSRNNLFGNNDVNIAFEAISLPDTVGISLNYWGIMPISDDLLLETIIGLEGYADVGPRNDEGQLSTMPATIPHIMDWED